MNNMRNKILSLLVLLLTAATGAWADGDTKYTVTFKANGNTKTVENVTLPHTFELDPIIIELYPSLSGGSGSPAGTSASGNTNVTAYHNNSKHYATISASFEGAVTVTGQFFKDFTNNQYTLEINCMEKLVAISDDKTEASFTMPTYDVTVNYELVRDMQDQANPVAFSGLPTTTTDPIVVKKGDNGKYQPIETLTIQLIDPLAPAEAQNIIAADGITIKVLVGAENGQGAIDYDQENPITLEAFLADMKPGYYWIKAVPTDETTSPYDGTVYSSEFTVVEKYDLTVKPANDFSKGKIESVTVGSGSVTIDANTGEATKTGIDPETEVKVKAKRGYVIDKVEVKKTMKLLTLTVNGVTIYYAEGDSWANAISRDENKESGLFIREGNRVHHNNYGQLVDSNTEAVLPVAIINANESYRFIK